MLHLTKLKPLIKRWPLVVATLLLPSIALAGGQATLVSVTESMQVAGQTIEKESNKITIIWDDVHTLRMDLGDSSHYLLMRDGKAYSISQEGGETLVMDMESMRSMVQAMGGQDQKENPFGSIDSVKATNTSETLAGIKGQVYHMTWTEADGSQKSGEAVLTDNPLVVEMTRAYLNSISAMAGAGDSNEFLDALPNNEQGMLQMGDLFYVESIQQMNPPASTFELPAKPMNLQDLFKG